MFQCATKRRGDQRERCTSQKSAALRTQASKTSRMSVDERKRLVWSIKKKLHQLTADEVFILATGIGQVEGLDATHLSKEDEESCVEYLTTYMTCPAIQGRDDQGLPVLKRLDCIIDGAIASRGQEPMSLQAEANVSEPVAQTSQAEEGASDVDMHTLLTRYDSLQSQIQQTQSTASSLDSERLFPSPASSSQSASQQPSRPPAPPPPAAQQPSTSEPAQQLPLLQIPVSRSEACPSHSGESMIAMKDLPLLSRKEFKIHGGLIGDTSSEVSYNSICKQINEGLKENHTQNEVIRGVLRTIKPGNFRDMLTIKEDLTVTELKSFLQSHLGEKSSTEFFQDLMCAKQHENETPQQFLYRMIGLKQKILFSLKQADSVVKYDMSTIQCIFLNTICQGIGEKYESVRRDLKTLLSDPSVTDEALLRQVIRTTTEESERKRRLGRSSAQKVTQAHAANTEHKEKTKDDVKVNHVNNDHTLQRLSAQVKALTEAMESLKALTALVPNLEHRDMSLNLPKQNTERKAQRSNCCPKCVTQANPNCNHCFVCGEDGHRALGCMKKQKPSGNWRRSGQRDHP